MNVNKALLKRIRITKNGKLMARRPGQNHFRARKNRAAKLFGKSQQSITIKPKTLGRYI